MFLLVLQHTIFISSNKFTAKQNIELRNYIRYSPGAMPSVIIGTQHLASYYMYTRSHAQRLGLTGLRHNFKNNRLQIWWE